ncbi:chaplin [Streptomyces sp. NRRL WC-3549]|uniref:chaplin n=1 Tax=Streptomyces sp. NRRL WC-3549 TaxID=1463925 RepID=UPI0004C95B6C|nr:chaplin family protein [Streptomyces sp. NRRL WC-3549]
MRQVTRKGLITMAAAGGVLALGGGYAHADAGAAGGATNSPGVLSGNSIQVPIDIPVNVCGNSVNVVGALNPVSGNGCGNGSSADAAHLQTSDEGPGPGQSSPGQGSGSHAADQGPGSGTAGHDEARDGGEGTGRHRASGASAQGEAQGSPGILSGNQVQVPVSVPLNVCGNGISVGGLLNPVFGNGCENETEPVTPEVPQTPHTPQKPAETPPEPQAPEPQFLSGEELAHTGAGGLDLLIPASAGMLLAGAGAVLYRRSRSAA